MEASKKQLIKELRNTTDVRPRKGGPYSLFCYGCRRWIPDTANHEMQKEGVFSHSHICCKKDGKIIIVSEPGIKDE